MCTVSFFLWYCIFILLNFIIPTEAPSNTHTHTHPHRLFYSPAAHFSSNAVRVDQCHAVPVGLYRCRPLPPALLPNKPCISTHNFHNHKLCFVAHRDQCVLENTGSHSVARSLEIKHEFDFTFIPKLFGQTRNFTVLLSSNDHGIVFCFKKVYLQ